MFGPPITAARAVAPPRGWMQRVKYIAPIANPTLAPAAMPLEGSLWQHMLFRLRQISNDRQLHSKVVPEHYGVLQIAGLQKLPLTLQYTPSPLLQQREY